MNSKSAVQKINKNGILLVFPLQNKSEPRSLWSEFYPRTKMRWEWDDNGDDRVAQMWGLMKKLSDGRQVVYSKWYRGRATFFSRPLFTALLCAVQKSTHQDLSKNSRILLKTLEMDSPLSTRNLKKFSEMQGKYNLPAYNKAMHDLFWRFLVVAFGEEDDGFFPSLAVGATASLYEDLWLEAKDMDAKAAWKLIDKQMPEGTAFRKYFDCLILKYSVY